MEKAESFGFFHFFCTDFLDLRLTYEGKTGIIILCLYTLSGTVQSDSSPVINRNFIIQEETDMSLVDSFKKMWNPPEDEYEDDYVDVYANSEPAASGHEEPKKEESRETVRRAAPQTSGNKVVNIHATAQLQVVLFKPEHFGEEIRAIADELLKMHTVVLNLEHTEESVSRRIIDFLSGVTYANKGKIKPVASNTFIITPYNVDLTGDEVVDELENSGVYF